MKILKEYILDLLIESIDDHRIKNKFIELSNLFVSRDADPSLMTQNKYFFDQSKIKRSLFSYISKKGMLEKSLEDLDLKEVYEAIQLFTSENVNFVRDPDNFNEHLINDLNITYTLKPSEKALKTYSDKYFDSVHYPLTPNKFNYESANSIIDILASVSYTSMLSRLRNTGLSLSGINTSKLYRGMNLDIKTIDKLRVGSIFNHGEMASWSYDLNQASRFAFSNVYGDRKAVIFECNYILRGTPVEHISKYPVEREVISSGDIKIINKSIKKIKGMNIFYIKSEQI